MSVLIKGMEMPNCCGNCPFIGYRTKGLYIGLEILCVCDGHILNPDLAYIANERHNNCPLSVVSIPHGRLIDADALKEKWLKAESRMGAEKVLKLPLREYISNGCVYDLDQEPTIIEPEGLT